MNEELFKTILRIKIKLFNNIVNNLPENAKNNVHKFAKLSLETIDESYSNKNKTREDGSNSIKSVKID